MQEVDCVVQGVKTIQNTGDRGREIIQADESLGSCLVLEGCNTCTQAWVIDLSPLQAKG